MKFLLRNCCSQLIYKPVAIYCCGQAYNDDTMIAQITNSGARQFCGSNKIFLTYSEKSVDFGQCGVLSGAACIFMCSKWIFGEVWNSSPTLANSIWLASSSNRPSSQHMNSEAEALGRGEREKSVSESVYHIHRCCWMLSVGVCIVYLSACTSSRKIPTCSIPGAFILLPDHTEFEALKRGIN